MERTKRIRNGEKAGGTFSDAEMERRLAALRRHMASTGIDAALFTSMHNIHYYSDFLYCDFGRPYGLIVTQEKAATISANIDYGQPWRRTFGDNLVYTDWQRDSYFEAVRHEAPAIGRIGVEFDHLSLEVHAKLRDALPGAEMVDIAGATMTMRTVKSAEEIALIKDGARIADIGGAACAEAIGEGVPEHEVALHATNAMVREIAAAHPKSEIRDTWAWFQSGINTDGAHNPVTTRRIEKGDILSLNCFPMIAGYYTALERTLFFASATDREIELWEINCGVHRRGCELIQPGARCCDIAGELNETFREHGLLEYRTFGYGHSFGVLSHYYGREAGLELREDIETVLEPGMVVSMEPMITIPQGEPGAGGYREHDILVVAEGGPRTSPGSPSARSTTSSARKGRDGLCARVNPGSIAVDPQQPAGTHPMSNPQPGIFAEGSAHHHHLELELRPGADAGRLKAAVAAARRDAMSSGAQMVVSFGPEAWRGIAPDRVPGALRPFTRIGRADGLHAPATQRDIWVWLHSGGRDTNFDSARAAYRALSGVATLAQEETGFVYHDSRDMIGFVDGTANPKTDADRWATALIPAGEMGEGGAYAMTQTWVHDLDKFQSLPVAEQERAIGRTKADDIELEGDALAPDAHIARTDVEQDGVKLKIFRRSIPYGGAARHGLHFVAFACDPMRFEVQLQRMFGTAGDGLHDHLIMFSAAETGSFWLAPSEDDLKAVLG